MPDGVCLKIGVSQDNLTSGLPLPLSPVNIFPGVELLELLLPAAGWLGDCPLRTAGPHALPSSGVLSWKNVTTQELCELGSTGLSASVGSISSTSTIQRSLT